MSTPARLAKIAPGLSRMPMRNPKDRATAVTPVPRRFAKRLSQPSPERS